MRSALFIVPLMLSLQNASAQSAHVDVAEITRDPKPFIGRAIRVAAVRCANEPNGLFACGAEHDNTRVRIESLGLDFRTSAGIRRKLSARCRKSLADASDACTFDAEFKPLNFRTSPPGTGSSKKTVHINVRRMDLF